MKVSLLKKTRNVSILYDKGSHCETSRCWKNATPQKILLKKSSLRGVASTPTPSPIRPSFKKRKPTFNENVRFQKRLPTTRPEHRTRVIIFVRSSDRSKDLKFVSCLVLDTAPCRLCRFRDASINRSVKMEFSTRGKHVPQSIRVFVDASRILDRFLFVFRGGFSGKFSLRKNKRGTCVYSRPAILREMIFFRENLACCRIYWRIKDI